MLSVFCVQICCLFCHFFIYKILRISYRSEQVHNVLTTSHLCRCDVMTSHRHKYDIISTSCAAGNVPPFEMFLVLRKVLFYPHIIVYFIVRFSAHAFYVY